MFAIEVEQDAEKRITDLSRATGKAPQAAVKGAISAYHEEFDDEQAV